MIEIQDINTSIHNRSTYILYKMIVDGKKLEVTVVTGLVNKINVYLRTPVQRAYGSLGKDFPDIDAAISAYRDKKVLLALSYIKLEINNETI